LVLPEMAWDLPTGARRIVQRARGYVATFVAGVQTIANDELTGELPGRLIRGGKQAAARPEAVPAWRTSPTPVRHVPRGWRPHDRATRLADGFSSGGCRAGKRVASWMARACCGHGGSCTRFGLHLLVRRVRRADRKRIRLVESQDQSGPDGHYFYRERAFPVC